MLVILSEGGLRKSDNAAVASHTSVASHTAFAAKAEACLPVWEEPKSLRSDGGEARERVRSEGAFIEGFREARSMRTCPSKPLNHSTPCPAQRALVAYPHPSHLEAAAANL